MSGGRRLQPMFDFTPLSQGVAVVFLVYVLLWPVGGVLLAIVQGVFDVSGLDKVGDVLAWPVPVVFPVGSLVLLIDFQRRLAASRMTTTQVTGYRAAAVFMIVGSLFALAGGHWWPAAVCLVGFAGLLLPTRGRTQPSTWTPP